VVKVVLVSAIVSGAASALSSEDALVDSRTSIPISLKI
jgi:hypothetical protein